MSVKLAKLKIYKCEKKDFPSFIPLLLKLALELIQILELDQAQKSTLDLNKCSNINNIIY